VQRQVYITIIIFIVTREFFAAYPRGTAGPFFGCKVGEWTAVAISAGRTVSGLRSEIRKKIGVGWTKGSVRRFT